jgi:hypothetical protein
MELAQRGGDLLPLGSALADLVCSYSNSKRTKTMKTKALITVALVSALALTTTVTQAQGVSAAEARAIANEACILGFSPVDNYRVQYAYYRNHP